MEVNPNSTANPRCVLRLAWFTTPSHGVRRLCCAVTLTVAPASSGTWEFAAPQGFRDLRDDDGGDGADAWFATAPASEAFRGAAPLRARNGAPIPQTVGRERGAPAVAADEHAVTAGGVRVVGERTFQALRSYALLVPVQVAPRVLRTRALRELVVAPAAPPPAAVAPACEASRTPAGRALRSSSKLTVPHSPQLSTALRARLGADAPAHGGGAVPSRSLAVPLPPVPRFAGPSVVTRSAAATAASVGAAGCSPSSPFVPLAVKLLALQTKTPPYRKRPAPGGEGGHAGATPQCGPDAAPRGLTHAQSPAFATAKRLASTTRPRHPSREEQEAAFMSSLQPFKARAAPPAPPAGATPRATPLRRSLSARSLGGHAPPPPPSSAHAWTPQRTVPVAPELATAVRSAARAPSHHHADPQPPSPFVARPAPRVSSGWAPQPASECVLPLFAFARRCLAEAN